jgi:uncharacterized protein
MNLLEKEKKLEVIIKSYKSAVVAYSGGVDSTLLLFLTFKYLGKDNVLALIADSETYPEREKREAIQFCKDNDINYEILYTEELKDERFAKNPIDRCYYCKIHLFSSAKKIKEKKGFDVIFEGSNADDIMDYRPGRNAVKEYSIISPLLLADLNKKEIRELSKKYGLQTYNKPSKACLASRIPYGVRIDVNTLKKIDESEAFLESLGFRCVRVRVHGEIARIEVDKKDMERLLEKREEIIEGLQRLGFLYVTLDLEGYKTGSMNKPILSSNLEII